MRIRGPLSVFTRRVEKSSPPDVLRAITYSLQEDYGVACSLYEFTDKVSAKGYRFLGKDDLLLVIPISDFTALCAALMEDVLHLFKLPFDAGSTVLEPDGIYWERRYELADPKSLDEILRIVQTNYDGHKGWPHHRSARRKS